MLVLLLLFIRLLCVSSSCDSSCATCSGADPWYCITCSPGYYMQPGNPSLCFNYCPVPYIPSIAQTCDSPGPDIIVDFVLDQIGPDVIDKKRNWKARNGARDSYYPPAFETTDPIPNRQRGYYFNGNQYLLLPPTPSSPSQQVLFGTELSVISWLRPQLFASQMGVLGMTVNNELLLSLGITLKPSGKIKLISRSGNLVDSGFTLTADRWHFLGVTFSASIGNSNIVTTIKMYLDGVLDTPNLWNGYLMHDIQGAGYIGQLYSADTPGFNGSPDYYTGFIYQVRLYNYAVAIVTLASLMAADIGSIPSVSLRGCSFAQYFDLNGICQNCRPDCQYGCVRIEDCTLCMDVLCALCTSHEAGYCTACKSNASFDTIHTCVCDGGYVYEASTNSCIPVTCHPTCLTCTGTAADACVTCKSHAHTVNSLGQRCECDTGFAGVPDSRNCLPCDLTCVSCSGVASSQCTACYASAHLDSPSTGNCVCDSGLIPFPTTSNCIPCDGTCLTCIGALSTQCQSCYSSASLSASPTGSCLCNLSYYGSPSSCLPCHSTCGTCAGGLANACQSCSSHASLSPTPTGSCTCDSGYYGTPPACSPCNTHCQTCISGLTSGCQSCYANASLTAYPTGYCVCDPGYYGNPAGCLPCSGTCKTCVGGLNSDCQSCHLHGILSPLPTGVCTCDTGYFMTSTSTCAACDSSCLSCTGGSQTECIFCYPHASLVTAPSACTCNSGYAPNPTSRTCVQCHQTCLTCTGATPAQCQSCHPNAVLTGTFSCTCLDGWFQSNSSGLCFPCNQRCVTCIGPDVNDCVSCPTASYLVTAPVSECMCNFGYTRDANSLCVLCDNTCETCTGPSNSQCLTCFPTAQLTSDFHCVCNSGYFNIPNTGSCAPCDPTCLSCSSSHAKNCTSCHAFAHILNGFCLCGNGFYPDPNSASCAPCHPICLSCTGPTASKCTQCASNLTFLSGTCMCPTGFYLKSPQNECIQCSPGCRICTDMQCVECVETLHLHSNGTCSDTCQISDISACKFQPEKCFDAILERNPDFTLNLTFSANLTQELSPFDIELNLYSADNQLIDISWEITMLSAYSQYKIILDAENDASHNSTATLQFPKSIYSSDCRLLSTQKLTITFNSTGNNEKNQPGLISTGQTPMSTMLVTLGVTTLVTGNTGLLWMFMHNVQMISYIPLSNIPLSEEMRTVLIGSNPIQLLPNPFTFFASEQSDLSEHIRNCDFTTLSFLYNTGEVMTSFCLLFLHILTIHLLSYLPFPKLRLWTHGKPLQLLKSNLPILIVETYLPCIVAVSLQLYGLSSQPTSLFDLISLISSTIYLLVLLITPFLVTSRTLKRLLHHNLQEHQLFQEFQHWDSKPYQLFYAFFCIRRGFYAFIQVFLPNFPHLQAIFNISHCLWVIFTQFLIFTTFFVKFKQNILKFVSIFSEFSIFLIFISVQGLFLDLNSSQKLGLELSIWGLICLIFAVHAVAVCYFISLQTYSILRRFKKANNKVK